MKSSNQLKYNKLKILWTVIKRLNMDKFVYVFLLNLLVIAAIITMVEPSIERYWDGIWYIFVACTTIGFGDFAAVTVIGRILTIYAALYEIVMVAIIPGVVVSYYLEVVQRRENEKLMNFVNKLEKLTEMSKEELEDISNTIKQFKKEGRI